MAENIVRSLKPNTRHVNLNGKRLKKLPRAISLVTNLVVLELKNNSIEELPSELSRLVNVGCILRRNNRPALYILCVIILLFCCSFKF